jgi:hypothetical protein
MYMVTKKTKAFLLMMITALSLVSMMTLSPVECYEFIPINLNGWNIPLIAVESFENWVLNIFVPPPAGVLPDSQLSLFYNEQNNEFNSLTVGTNDQASALNGTGYYFARCAEYATMNYLGTSPFPEYQIMQYSDENTNGSIATTLENITASWCSGYSSVIQDSVRYAQQSFTGSLSGLSLKVGSSNVATMTNDFLLMYGETYTAPSTTSAQNINEGYLISEDSPVFYSITGEATPITGGYSWGDQGMCTLIFTNADNSNQTIAYNASLVDGGTMSNEIILPSGIWQVNVTNAYSSTDYALNLNILSDGCWINSPTSTTFTPCVYIVSNATKGLYSSLTFINTEGAQSVINLGNTTTINLIPAMQALDGAQNFALGCASAYWTVLTGAGITSASQIPPNEVVPPPDVAFLTNDDLSLLSPQEISAFYLAYLHSLANFYNSTTYQTISHMTLANVTFSNAAVVINGSLLTVQNVSAGSPGSLEVGTTGFDTLSSTYTIPSTLSDPNYPILWGWAGDYPYYAFSDYNPLGKTITSATLYFYQAGTSSGSTYSGTCYALQPGTGTAINSAPLPSSLAGYVPIDVTAYMQSCASGSTTFNGFVINDTVSAGEIYAGGAESNSTDPVYLQINTTSGSGNYTLQYTTWTTGDLYIQVYADMNLTDGMNLLNSSGLIFNLNDTTCYSYSAGDYLNISHIYIKTSDNGQYTEVNSTEINATSISAYLYTAYSGPAAQAYPPPAPTGGSSLGELAIILFVVLIVIVALRKPSSSGSINVKV